MITKIRFENFRSHGDSVFPLQPISLFIGTVASGKSNVFKGLQFIQSSIYRKLDELFPPGLGEFPRVRSRWAGETAPIGFEVELEGISGYPGRVAVYKLRLADSPRGVYVLEENLTYRDPYGPPPVFAFQRDNRAREMGAFGLVDPYDPTLLHRVAYDDGINRTAEEVLFARKVAHDLSRFGYYHLSFQALKSPGTGRSGDGIGHYGQGLPDFLYWAKSDERYGTVYKEILDSMREVLPNLESINATWIGTNQPVLAMSFRGQRGFIAAADLSDGTLLTLGLLCLIHSPSRPALLCLEEPEAGLNPRRLRWLLDRFVDLAYPRDGGEPTQVLLSTHSPWLVDLFKETPGAVLLVEQTEGRSRVTPLIDIQRDKLHQEPSEDEPIGHLWATGVYEGL